MERIRIHQLLVFIQETHRFIRDHLWLSLYPLKVELVPSIPNSPAYLVRYPSNLVFQLGVEKVGISIRAFL